VDALHTSATADVITTIAISPLPPPPLPTSPPSYSITVFAAASRGLEVTGSNHLTGVCPPRFFLPLTTCHILPLSLAAKTLFILPRQVRPSAERSITVYMVPCRLRLLIRLLMFCFQPAAFRGRDAPRVGRSQARISRANLHLPAVFIFTRGFDVRGGRVEWSCSGLVDRVDIILWIRGTI
jgi:hypothetical protein